MSSLGIPEGTVLQMEVPPTREVKCPHCGQVSHQPMPPLQLMNTPTFSGVMLAHEQPRQCPNCSKLFQCVVAGITGVKLEWVPVVLVESLPLQPQPTVVAPSKKLWTPPQ